MDTRISPSFGNLIETLFSTKWEVLANWGNIRWWTYNTGHTILIYHEIYHESSGYEKLLIGFSIIKDRCLDYFEILPKYRGQGLAVDAIENLEAEFDKVKSVYSKLEFWEHIKKEYEFEFTIEED